MTDIHMDEVMVMKMTDEEFETLGRLIAKGNRAFTPEMWLRVYGYARRHRSQEWRDIKDAPKDGTPIIGAYFDVPRADSHLKGRIVRCWYQPEFSAFISSCRQMTLAADYTFAGGTRQKIHSPEIETVSHYLPLPEPPK